MVSLVSMRISVNVPSQGITGNTEISYLQDSNLTADWFPADLSFAGFGVCLCKTSAVVTLLLSEDKF